MAILLYIYAGCSFRSVARSLEVIDFVYPDLGLADISHVTIRDWVQKVGLDAYKNRCKDLAADGYSIIMDESITIAEHKILLGLAAPAEHPGKPLTRADVEVVDIHVASSHKGEDVNQAVNRITKKAGKKPAYAVTDNGRNLAKGLSEAGIMSHKDISHTFGTYLKAVYGEDESFRSLTKAIGNARHFALTDVDYLMPCNMRALARWMNVSDWIRWAKSMTVVSHKLTGKERKMYSFLGEHGALVDELDEAMRCFEKVLSICKRRGLSGQSAAECISIVNRELMGRGERLTRLGSMMVGYFTREAALLESDTAVHNVSSDIIESLFGCFKQRKSPNRMYGVTGFVLVLPLATRLGTLENARKVDFGACLGRNHTADIKAWEKENLPENLAAKRARILRQAC